MVRSDKQGGCNIITEVRIYTKDDLYFNGFFKNTGSPFPSNRPKHVVSR